MVHKILAPSTVTGTLHISFTNASGEHRVPPPLRAGARVCDLGFSGADHTVVDAALIRPGAVSVSLRTDVRRRSAAACRRRDETERHHDQSDHRSAAVEMQNIAAALTRTQHHIGKGEV